MRLFTAALLATALGGAAALAQVGQVSAWPPTQFVAAGGGYTGPLDIVSGAAAAWGLRALSAAWADGTHLSVRVHRTSDSEVCDVLLNTSGDLGNTVAGSGAACAHAATPIATWCAATACGIDSWYDQSGHSLDAGASNLGAEAVLTFSPTTTDGFFSEGYCSSGTVALAQTVSTSTVYKAVNNSSFQSILAFDGSFSQFGAPSTPADTAFIFASTVVKVTATDNAYHAAQAIFAGASSSTYIDGATTSSLNPGTGSSATAIVCFGNGANSLTNLFVGSVREGIIWPSAAAASFASSLSALNSNQHTYWGF